MPYLQFGAWSKMLRKQASFSPFACYIEKKSSKLPHKLFLFQFFIKKKNITDGAGSGFVRIALGVKSQQTAFI